jgi:xanthine dehydrogenase small subunit
VKARNSALIYLNGERVAVPADQAGMMLADYLRLKKGLSGTKIVCAEGDCGACTVLRSFAGSKSDPSFQPINACILTVAQLDGSSLVTVDALARDSADLTPVQSSMRSCHGSQCGFCTPGFVMALTGLVEEKISKVKNKAGSLTAREAKNALTGNLCRCTGYQSIIDAAVEIPLKNCVSVKSSFVTPEQTRELKKAVREPLHLKSESFEFFAPVTVKIACQYLTKNPKARILAGATDLGVLHNKWKGRLAQVLSLHLIPELYNLKNTKGRIEVGARVTLAELRSFLKVNFATDSTSAIEFVKFLDLFASPQIKNVATLVGNLANASPIADTPPFLLISETLVEVAGARGTRLIPIEEFFLGYRKTAVKPGEIITKISFVLPKKNESFVLRKVSERKDLDISAVNAAFRLSFTDTKKTRIKEAWLALGGVAATPLRLRKTEKTLCGRDLDSGNILLTIESAVESLQAEIQPIGDVRGSAAYRRVLAENLLRSFLSNVDVSAGTGAKSSSEASL